MALPPRLEKELEELLESHQIEVEEGPCINLIFQAFPLGEGFSKSSSDLLLRIPLPYPDAGPDMFWLDMSVTLANGAIPQAAEQIETYNGRSWRRFSWHRAAWNPLIDNIHGYLEFVRRRLREKR